ncbi:MAG TPA: arginine--tRNA ligase [Verrucomicrobiales bacterium]|nr:arginine--tRNA ligase [Verrucomicrobiales bacterium]
MTIPFLLQQRVNAALAGLGQPVPEGFVAEVVPAADTRYGDYQTNAAMPLAKGLKTNPRALATELAGKIDVAGISDAPSVAGPGFINFTIKPEALASRLESLLGDPRLGVEPVAEPKTVVIDFSAPNVAKQMHVGHIRSTIIGDCLARVARFLGHHVITDNHIGDWGTQFGMVLYGWKHFLDEKALEADPIRELLRLYKAVNEQSKKEELAKEAGERPDTPTREACKAELVKLQAGDEENLTIWRKCVEMSLKGLSVVYGKLDVTFDHFLGESFYNDRLASLVQELKDKGIARLSDGAQCIFFDDVPGMADKAPFIIQKTDGGFGYATTDLATVEHRVKEWSADEIWYVVGAPQSLHFEQLFHAVRRWGLNPVMHHIAFGSILGADGKMMKTRSGESVGLLEVLEEAEERARAVVEEKNAELSAAEKEEIAQAVGIGAVKYLELSQHRLTDYKFVWDKMLSFQGNTAPYLQNAYVRTQGIFRKLEGTANLSGPYAITEKEERELALTLCKFAETVPAVLTDFRPNLLAGYLYDTARAFHSFFEACPVLRAEGTARATRLALCEATSRVLKTGLDLMGIRVTERM